MEINSAQLMKLTKDENTYKEGILLAQSGACTQISYNSSLNSYYVVVYDNNVKHEIIIYLNAQKEIHRYQCDCLSFKKANQACKHIICALKAIELSQNNSTISSASNKLAMAKIFNLANEHEQDLNEQKLIIQSQLYINKDPVKTNPISQYYISFKIGINKLYVLKDILELLDAHEYQRDLYFGVDFVYQPDIESFNSNFLNTLSFLKKVYEIEKSSNGRFFEGKKVYLTDSQLKELLSYWVNKKIYFMDNLVEVSDDLYPDFVDLSLKAGSIIADISKTYDIYSLFLDDSILVDKDYLYLLDKNISMKLHPFFEAKRLDLKTIYFDGDNRTAFIENVIPYLEDIKLIPEQIQALYIKGFLKASLYLDRSENSIVAKPLFSYNKFSFNPFSNTTIPFSKGKFVLRDIKKEQKIMHILEKAGFLVNRSNIYLDDDDLINQFIFEYLPYIQQLMDVQYSDSFKNVIQKRNIHTAIKLNSDIDLFEVDLDLDNFSYPEFQRLLEAYHLKHHYYRLKDGSFLSLDDVDTIRSFQMLDHLNITEENFNKGKITIPLNRAFYLQDYTDQFSEVDAFNAFMNRFNNYTNQEYQVPASLNASLRDYQIVGYNWLKTLSEYKLGGILADDMGLGKTLQTITYILDEVEHGKKQHMIVCPTSLIFNWQEEIKRFAPTLKTIAIYGMQNERLELIKKMPDYDIILTSYPLLRRDIDAYEEYTFDTVILDEAQYIKNASSLNAKASKRLKSKIRFALTGTPIENSLSELWSIFDFILPKYFSNERYFALNYEYPIIKERDQKVAELLQKQIKPFILRRMKKDVLKELPEKLESKISVKMTPKQQELYYTYLKECVYDINHSGSNIINNRIEIFARLTHLRQICNHPALFYEDYEGQSAKLLLLMELVRESIESKHHILIFSQFTTMLKLISEELEKNEIPFYYLDGNTKLDDRSRMVRHFNQGRKPVFLISLKAGGTGLNLVGADTVIHVDPWWNPAVEDQATDRAYRIGQKNKVQVIKLITAQSIEEKIYNLQESKKDLVDSIIKPGENFITHLSENEIYDLFTLDK